MSRDTSFFRDRLARHSHETRRDREGLVSNRLFSRRDRLVTCPREEGHSSKRRREKVGKLPKEGGKALLNYTVRNAFCSSSRGEIICCCIPLEFFAGNSQSYLC